MSDPRRLLPKLFREMAAAREKAANEEDREGT
jgi:hypothetical protein